MHVDDEVCDVGHDVGKHVLEAGHLLLAPAYDRPHSLARTQYIDLGADHVTLYPSILDSQIQYNTLST